MKRIIAIIFAISFIIAGGVSAETTYSNCGWERPASPESLTCSAVGKTEAYPSNCQGLPKPSPYGENANIPCCCAANTGSQSQYSCRWASSPNANPYGQVSAPECFASEREGTDCDLAKKPNYVQTKCCCPSNFVYQPAAWIMPELSIPINTVHFTEATCDDPENPTTCKIPWISQYINGIYRYGLGIGGILAAIMLMAGGVMWLVSAGDASRITKAKSLIIGSVTGLIILVGTYTILKQINPDLIKLNALALNSIERINIEPDSEGTTAVALDMAGISGIIGVDCNNTSIEEIINNSKGKTTYNNPQRGKTGPNGTVFNDCSGFASFAIKCANGKTADQNTAGIFKDQSAWNGQVSSLKPGDLIGWAPSNSKSGFGHVFIYMGNGKFGDCHGGTSGRQPGNCISNDLDSNDIKSSANRHSGGELFFKRY
ncbi:MAG: NlpC/P60 family protein [Bacillota bacterium]